MVEFIHAEFHLNNFEEPTTTNKHIQIQSNEIKFLHHNFKDKIYAPVFSGFTGLTYKVNEILKT